MIVVEPMTQQDQILWLIFFAGLTVGCLLCLGLIWGWAEVKKWRYNRQALLLGRRLRREASLLYWWRA